MRSPRGFDLSCHYYKGYQNAIGSLLQQLEDEQIRPVSTVLLHSLGALPISARIRRMPIALRVCDAHAYMRVGDLGSVAFLVLVPATFFHVGVSTMPGVDSPLHLDNGNWLVRT